MRELDIIIGFYRSDSPSATFLDRLIAWWTKSTYSHVEIAVGNKWISVQTDYIRVLPLDRDKLVELEGNTYDYVVKKIKVTHKQYMDFWQYVYEEMTPKKYDWLGIFTSQIIKIGVQDNNKWFCSEATCKLLQILGDEKAWRCNPEDMSPGDLSKIYRGERY